MVTMKGNLDSCAGSTHQSSRSLSMRSDWAESMEIADPINDVVNKDDKSDRFEIFFIVKRNDGNFNMTSPFLIHKAIQGLVGDPKSVKKLRSGDLLIEVKNKQQANNLKKCTKFGDISVSVSPHRTLNTSRGVISEPDLIHVTEAEIVENLKEQDVIEARRIKIYRQDEQEPTNKREIPTKHIILTFNKPNLPNSIKAGYMSCPVRAYIPNPMLCHKCQRFGHTMKSCRGQKIICGRCSAEGHDSRGCMAPPLCTNCKGDHPTYAKTCERWKMEKEIITIRTKNNLSYPEARKIVDSRTPSTGISYANTVLKTIKRGHSIATQTDPIVTICEQKSSNTKNIPVPPKQSIPPKPLQTQSNISSSPKKLQLAPPKITPNDSPNIPQISNLNAPKPIFLKNPTHKKTTSSTQKSQPVKQNRKSDTEKHNLPDVKATMALTNKKSYKKTKKELEWKDNGAKDILDLDPGSDLSDHDGVDMSTASEQMT